MDPIEQKDLAMMRARFNDMGVLHPKARGAFLLLANDLHRAFLDGRTHVHFKAFETFRSPWRQKSVMDNGTSQADMYESAHAFGLAVDFVPNIGGRWSWSLTHPWDFLRDAARARGLLCELDWDRAHVEHPLFQDWKACMRSM